MTGLSETLQARKAQHGDFTEHAEVSQRLKEVVHGYPNWLTMTLVQREAVEMILHKIGRVMAGNPHFHDHWHDIAGYATLVSDRTNKEP